MAAALLVVGNWWLMVALVLLLGQQVARTEPTMYSFCKLVLTVWRPLKPITIAVIPNAIMIAAATNPPISSTLRISASIPFITLKGASRRPPRAVSGRNARPRYGNSRIYSAVSSRPCAIA